MLKFEITPAVLDDVVGMEDVRHQAWLTTYPNSEHRITLEDIEYRFRDRHSAEEIKKRQDRVANPRTGERWLVAKENNLVVGFCLVINSAEENKLSSLYVLPTHQGRGIGTALWQEGHKYLDSRRPVEVWTAIYNAQAIGFYRKLGFEETGERDLDPWLTMRNGAIIPEIQMVRNAESVS